MQRDDVTIGMSVGEKNKDKACATARALALACSGRRRLVLETDLPRRSLPADFRAQLGEWDAVWLWDSECTAAVLDGWPASLARPFEREISYGGNRNHVLILTAYTAGRYLVQFDPGTYPMEDPGDFVSRHQSALSCGKLISGQYNGRVALRDDFAVDCKKPEFYKVIRKYTGVDPRPGRQVTAGASLARLVSSRPDIPFSGVMIWASDDHFLKTCYPQDVDVDQVAVVGRGEPGYPQSCDQYVTRLAHAVILEQRRSGNQDRAAVVAVVRDFFALMRDLVKPDRVGDVEGIDADTLPIGAIFSGYENYGRLVDQWPEVLAEGVHRLDGCELRIQ